MSPGTRNAANVQFVPSAPDQYSYNSGVGKMMLIPDNLGIGTFPFEGINPELAEGLRQTGRRAQCDIFRCSRNKETNV